MKLKIHTIDHYFGIIYWLITLFIFAFIGRNDGFDFDLMVAYIPGNKWLIHFSLLTILIFFYIVCIKNLKFDFTMSALLLKFLFDIMSTYIINTPVSFSFILWADTGVMFYFVCRNSKVKLEAILDCYEIFAIILSLQTIYTGIEITRQGITFENVAFKWMMRIPFAPSNLIADIISSALVCAFVRIKKQKTSIILFFLKTLLYVVSILYIRSRGSILLLVAFLDWILFRKISKIVRKWIRVVLFLILLIINILVIQNALSSMAVETYFGRYQDVGASNDVTSGRVGIWADSWNAFLSNPIFGKGITYATENNADFTGSHNIWLETLMNSGGIGFILHFIAVLYLAYKTKKKIRKQIEYDRQISACIAVLLFLYINSLFEESYYNYINDTIFWSLSGFLVSRLSDPVPLMELSVFRSKNCKIKNIFATIKPLKEGNCLKSVG